MGEFAIVMERVVKRFEDVVAVNDVSLKVVGVNFLVCLVLMVLAKPRR